MYRQDGSGRRLLVFLVGVLVRPEPFGALLRRRNELEYPHLSADTATSEEAGHAAGTGQRPDFQWQLGGAMSDTSPSPAASSR